MTAKTIGFPAFDSTEAVWIEITSTQHRHGGDGWEFGTCLWSPTVDIAGRRRYELMRQLEPGDVVIHWLRGQGSEHDSEAFISGWSRVAAPAVVTDDVPPLPGAWAGMGPYFRVELAGYTELQNPVPVGAFLDAATDLILEELKTFKPKHYPISRYGDGVRTRQGQYLSRCTASLFGLIQEAISLEDVMTAENVSLAERPHFSAEFFEARRSAKERSFFARSPELVRMAKAHYGSICQACGFDFERVYGELGAGYVECHHLEPLGERSDTREEGIEVTSLGDVTVLCANCHRMIHRRRPALQMEELRAILRSNSVGD